MALTTVQRGYDWTHRRQRASWAPAVDAGNGYCHATICAMPTRWIPPGTPWHLGHTVDRTAWTGPEHQRCNVADANRRRTRRHRAITARRW